MIHAILAAVLIAHAAVEPTDYTWEVVRRARATMEGLAAEERLEEAVAHGTRVQKRVGRTPELEYEVALALNRMGETKKARRHYRRVIRMEPEHAGAWYDLGEIHLAAGQLGEAEEAFGRASQARPDHWVGPFRLAEVAARRHEPGAMEAHLREALARGFSFRAIVGDPNWRGYYRDASLAEVIRGLISVYSDDAILESLEVEWDR